MKKNVLLLSVMALVASCATNEPANTAGSGEDAFAMVARADRAYKQGKWKEAEQAYRAVAAKVPNDAYAYFRLGNSLAKQLRFDAAAKAYKASLVRDANKTKVYHNLAMIHLLQAESSLAAGLKTIPEQDGNAAQVKYMLWQLKKITRVSLQDMQSPTAAN
jgi:Flp pilus assembly protein TadD